MQTQLQHFNDNYLDYTLKDGKLYYDENHKGFEKECARQMTQNKINQLKQQLSAMDYQTSKYADGEYTQSEWQAIVAERKNLRLQIRSLENQV